MALNAFPIETVTIDGADRVAILDSNQVPTTSPYFILNETVGTLAVVSAGLDANGFLVMIPGSVPNDIVSGYAFPDTKWAGGMLWDGAGGRGFGIMGANGEPDFWIKNSAFYTNNGSQDIWDSAFQFGPQAPSTNVRVRITGLTDNSSSYVLGLTDRTQTRTLLLVRSDGQISIEATNTTPGTTGAQSINKASGKVNFAAGATSLVVTNALCQTTSIVHATVLTDDATAYVKNVVPGNGNFTIKLGAAATSESSVGFIVYN